MSDIIKERRKLNLVIEPTTDIGLGVCWKISTAALTIVIPTREIKRLISNNIDCNGTKIILTDERSIQVPMSIDEIFEALNASNEEKP